jgi:protein-S-isoprenylcysteine O-methyltransferase Ste14
MNMSPAWPLIVALISWAAWFGFWMATSAWSKPTVAAPKPGSERLYSMLVYLGFALLVAPTAHSRLGPPLWSLSKPLDWALAALAMIGLGFAWWARLHLGRDWSWTITRKEDHRLVDTGPYSRVRHPIYTGLLVAAVATAALQAKWSAMVGLALFVAGFWLKARLEERFLSEELGSAAYLSYVNRTGMLLPRL